ncbi:cation transporter [Ascosphaera apis ARSEF 7405]|uniref:Cation transporter n=1 Tax=Ascosphaera apis ARSEF 7405 TaxID=392613 RepID=A0A168AH44_9EURO|nr:cation transporter [Ascosphaera apis ARSEF 7405]
MIPLIVRPVQKLGRFLVWLFPLNFITLHYAYYFFTVLLASVILWGSSTPPRSVHVPYTDALFLCVSAMTLSGLNTVNLSDLNTFQQVILFLLTILGSPVLVSAVVVLIRKTAFESRFKSIVSENKRIIIPSDAKEAEDVSGPKDGCRSGESTAYSSNLDLMLKSPKGLSTLSEGVQGLVGRNSAFYGLTAEDRRKLGGVEYRALSLLSVLVPLYCFSFQFLGAIGLGAWISNRQPEVARANSMKPWWVGIFNSISAFNNNGMSLLDDNVTVFQSSPYVLLTMGFLILAGHTCYPVFLRFIIWTWNKMLPNQQKWHDLRVTLQFLLDHPRRCYTHLFPAKHTWFLVGSLVFVNGIDWSMFEILNIGNKNIGHLSTPTKVLDGLFQAFAVRSGGFYVVPMADLRLSMLVLYVLMMYLSVYPVVITMRNSNVSVRYVNLPVVSPSSSAGSGRGGGRGDGNFKRIVLFADLESTSSMQRY